MEQRILKLISEYLDNHLQLPEFQQQFAGFYFQVRQNGNVGAASELCDKVIGPLAELSRGHRSEESLRQELTASIRPFVERPFAENYCGDLSPLPQPELIAEFASNVAEA